jgi:dihydrofolate synthase / folylpolyglutamate synthase
LQTVIENLSRREVFTPMDVNDLRKIFLPLIDKINKIKPFIITVVGTNGKGETARNLERISLSIPDMLSSAMWTSPHIKDFAERFSFNGQLSEDESLRNSLSYFLKLYPQNSCNLSFYELSFWIFCHQAIVNNSDILILEVGLGGRLDAVNLFDANVTILTSISRDHTEILGKKYKHIVFEKLGVLRKASALVYSVRSKYVKKLVEEATSNVGSSEVFFISPDDKKYICYKERNWVLASKGFELLTGIKKHIPYDASWVSLGRGNSMKWRGHRLIFYNSHNLDAHREFLKNKINKENQFLILFFSQRVEREIKAIQLLYRKYFKGDFVIGAIDSHYKILSKKKIKNILGDESKIIDFSDQKNAEDTLFSIGAGKYLITGTNFIQKMLMEKAGV